jgi:hypothetical protein
VSIAKIAKRGDFDVNGDWKDPSLKWALSNWQTDDRLQQLKDILAGGNSQGKRWTNLDPSIRAPRNLGGFPIVIDILDEQEGGNSHDMLKE